MVYTDPYSDPKKDFVESQQRRTMNEFDMTTDFGQPQEVTMMDIQIDNGDIIVRTRPQNPVYLLINTPLITVSQQLFTKAGRVYQNKNIRLAHQCIKTKLSQAHFWYCKQSKTKEGADKKLSMLRQPFDITIDFTKLAYSKMIEQSCHEALDKSSTVDIFFDPVCFVIP